MKNDLSILYHDQYLVAVNKPPGMLVHRTSMAYGASTFVLQVLRNQLNQKVYPVHRIDRKTSGVLLFALDPQSNQHMQTLFAQNKINKNYIAIVRGYTEENGIIDYPLQREDGMIQEAITTYKTIGRCELPVASGKNPTSRYSLVEVKPLTGRTHQIRRHFAHIFHPIIGDRPHGCNKQNKLFKEKWNMTTMMLHAKSLEFTHPFTGINIQIEAPLWPEFKRVMVLMNWPV